MTAEEKQLLLKDLCARLPYGVKMRYKDDSGYEVLCQIDTFYKDVDGFRCLLRTTGPYGAFQDLNELKPYLRPMSSMTEDEREEIEVFIFNKWYQENSCKIDKEGWIEILANYDVSGIDPCFCSDYVDWLNAHHFDYRGLIKKGLWKHQRECINDFRI